MANYLFARRHGGRFVLRLDDTDRERKRAEYAEAIAHDLRWLGLEWDATFRQSRPAGPLCRGGRAAEASGRLYPCFEVCPRN